jgi:peptidoglycan/xylan/chitin deacetylase (PgdA/CDA1 family)
MTDVLVLCYHAVSKRWPADLAVTAEELARQLEFLVLRGYRGVTFSEAVGSPVGERVLCVTFDDAYTSVLDHAFPVLNSLNLPGTVFAVTDFVDKHRALSWPGIDHWQDGPHEPELRGLSWGQLGSLADAGWEVGSHTATHPRLTQLADSALADELLRSKNACEEALGKSCRTLAYPYGDVDARVVRAAARAGYAAAAVLTHRVLEPAVLSWPRVGVYRPDSFRRFRLKVSPALRRVRTRFARVEEAIRG